MHSISTTATKYAFDYTDRYYRAIRGFIDSISGGTTGTINLNIAADDAMYRVAENHAGDDRFRALRDYFHTGLRIIDAINQLVDWYFDDWNNVSTYLDFASGHGRSTRFLNSLIPSGRVWVAEILPSAVHFQSDEFGFHAVQSHSAPEYLTLHKTFDLIFVCSLFTHLPELSFQRWLARLYSLVNPGGLLIFTVHDESLKSNDISLNSRGFFFGASSEIRDLDPNEYGFSFANESFVRKVIKQTTGCTDYGRVPRGLAGHQDIYFVARNGKIDFSKFKFDRGANWFIDRLVVDPSYRTLSISGWTVNMTQDILVDRIDVFFKDRLIAAAKLTIDRPDVARHFGEEHNPQYRMCGWKLETALPSDADPCSDFIVIKAVTTSGKQLILDYQLLDSIHTTPA